MRSSRDAAKTLYHRANREVVENLNSIGLYALIITISIILFSILTMMAARKMMGIDRYGNLCKKSGGGKR